MTFNLTLCAVDRVGQTPRRGDVDRAVSIEFQRSAQRSKPWGPEDAPRPSHPRVLSDSRASVLASQNQRSSFAVTGSSGAASPWPKALM
jgi:hypothetical protein